MTVTPMAISLINFPDKLTECLIPIQIQELTIPKQGEYVFSVTADGELITQRSIEFIVNGNSQ